MAASLGGDADDPIATINVTPFVDIILVVLIIFMVTAPMIMQPSINVNLPEASSGESTLPTSLQISMSRDGTIQLNGAPSDLDSLASYAEKAVAEKPDLQAVIAADKEVPHGQVVSVIDAVKRAGIKKFAISIEQK